MISSYGMLPIIFYLHVTTQWKVIQLGDRGMVVRTSYSSLIMYNTLWRYFVWDTTILIWKKSVSKENKFFSNSIYSPKQNLLNIRIERMTILSECYQFYVKRWNETRKILLRQKNRRKLIIFRTCWCKLNLLLIFCLRLNLSLLLASFSKRVSTLWCRTLLYHEYLLAIKRCLRLFWFI